MSTFVCYSSKDKKEVDSLAIEARKGSYQDLWISHIDGVPTARNDEDYIVKQINNSQGAILMLSKNFLDSDFIKRVELPLIIKQQKERENFEIAVLLVSDCNYKSIDYFKNRQFINSSSTTLDFVTPSQQSLILKEALSKFPRGQDSNFKISEMSYEEIVENLDKEILENELSNLKVRNRIFTVGGLVLIIIIASYTFLKNIASSNLNQSVDITVTSPAIQKGTEVYLNYLTSNITKQNVDDVFLFSDYDFLSHGEWVCSLLDKGIQHYFIYDGLWFLVAQDLNKYDAGESITGDQMWSAVYFIFHGANDYLCEYPVDTSKLENKFNLHKNLTTDNYEWRSNLFNDSFNEGYLNNLFELLDISDPPLSLLGYFDSQDEFYELMIAACETILPMEPIEYLEYVQEDFSLATNLEEQNATWDFQEIILLAVPPWFCPDLEDKGVRLSTYIYLVDFKFNPYP